METVTRHEVPAGVAPTRLDRYAAGAFAVLASVKGAHKLARRGGLRVDGHAAEPSRLVRPGDVIELVETALPRPKVFERTLTLVFEDDAHAVVLKPPGLPTSGNAHRTLEHALPHNLAPSSAPDALAWPRPMHRLDRRTGGLLLVAKTAAAAVDLGRQFEARRIDKHYRALAVGRLDGEGVVDDPVEGREAVTGYRALDHVRSLHSGWLTTVALHPRTGRTHQLRRHLAGLGHPVLGDDLYGIEGQILRGSGLFLWALRLGWHDPRTGRRREAALDEPRKFETTRRREQRRWDRVHRDEGRSR